MWMVAQRVHYSCDCFNSPLPLCGCMDCLSRPQPAWGAGCPLPDASCWRSDPQPRCGSTMAEWAPSKSVRRRWLIFFTSPRAVLSSDSGWQCSLRSSSRSTVARLLRRATSTNGKPKRSRYCALSLCSRSRSSVSRLVSPAWLCSRCDSAVSVPCCRSRPARSG